VLRKTETGFSLIEAIVALVILSLVFTAIWEWFATATNSTKRIEQALSLPEVFSQFVVNLELEDLQDRQSGRYQIGQYDVEWQANIISRSDQEAYRRQPAWIVTLFDINAVILENGQLITTFDTKTIQQWKDPSYIESTEF
jgi:type II secretory pathway component PulJ